ncbi:MAG: DUF1273 family protein [Oscillospiraceae bacterium]|nr:DUF1273 family protein [Oscillospiraceae bacterium]
MGHREASSELLPILRQTVEKHISEYGVTEFIVGGYGGFDHLASKAVISLKQQHPQITLSLLIPYHPVERPIETPPGFDNTYYPSGMEKVPRKLAIVRANRYMVENIDYLIAYAWHPASSARNLVEYAEKRKVEVTNLGQDRSFLFLDAQK